MRLFPWAWYCNALRTSVLAAQRQCVGIADVMDWSLFQSQGTRDYLKPVWHPVEALFGARLDVS